ncbi:MAG: hypothetical protein AAF216_10065 [Pseudomonadota bacterium]
MKTTFKALTFALAALTCAGTASAAGSSNAHTISFSYASSDSASEIYGDFQRTASRACRGAGHGLRGLDKRRARTACRDDLLARAVTATRLPRLVAYYERRTGDSITPVQFASLN